MPECTEAERAFLDLSFRDRVSADELKAARAAVSHERADPKLVEQFVTASLLVKIAHLRMDAAHKALWGVCPFSEQVCDKMEEEAVRRFDEWKRGEGIEDTDPYKVVYQGVS